jgi:hypothetical protein
LANMPSGIVTKPPKPGFVGFGSTYPGDYQELFSVLLDEVAFIEGVIFLRPALEVDWGSKGVGALQNHWMTPVRVGVMSGINKSRHQPLPVSFIGNSLLPPDYAQLEDNLRKSMIYMILVEVRVI